MGNLVDFDRGYLEDFSGIVGVDEVGRGAIAGPVVAVALCVKTSFYRQKWQKKECDLVQDSKRLNSQQRETAVRQLFSWKKEGWLNWAVGRVTHRTVDRVNVFHATVLAMGNALKHLEERLPSPHCLSPSYVILIDGIPLKRLPYSHRSLTGGDDKSFAIAGASVIAKVVRDTYMTTHFDASRYGFAQHKGYGTKKHMDALRKYGSSAIHRKSFISKV